MRRSDGGFTIVELLIALSLMFVSLLGMMSLQVIAQRAARQSRAMTEAVALAQDRLEMTRRLPVIGLTGSAEAALDEKGQAIASGAYRRTMTVTPTPGGSLVRVDVSWTDFAGKAHAVTLRTIRAQ